MERAGRAVGPLPGMAADAAVAAGRERARPYGGGRLQICVVLLPIEPYSPSGGAIATVVRYVTREWERAGHAVTVLAPRGEAAPYAEGRSVVLGSRRGPRLPRGPLLPRDLSTRITRQAHWDWPGYRRHLAAVQRAVRSLDQAPDVLIAHNDLQLLPELATLAPEAQTVLWLHNEVRTARPDPLRALEGTDWIVAVSDYIARWTERHYGLAAGTVRTAYNGVDLERFRPEPRCRLPGPPLRVVCHGRIDPGKGYHLVVDAVGRLRARGVAVDLTLAGGLQAFGLAPAAAEAYRDRLLASLERVGGTYLGRIDPDEVPDLLRAADVACAPSLHREPFCLSALEAMASGCALVASDRGGLPEVCGDAGILVDLDDPGALDDALAALAGDRAFLAERRQAARDRAERFPWSAPAAVALGGRPVPHRP